MMVASEWMILKMEIEELRRMAEKETENREKKRIQRQRQQRQKRTVHRMSYLTGRQISPWTAKR